MEFKLNDRAKVEKYLADKEKSLVHHRRGLTSENFEIRCGSELFVQKDEFLAELARGYLLYLDSMIAAEAVKCP